MKVKKTVCHLFRRFHVIRKAKCDPHELSQGCSRFSRLTTLLNFKLDASWTLMAMGFVRYN